MTMPVRPADTASTAAPRASMLARVLAVTAGILLAIPFAIATAGAALVATIATVGIGIRQARRGRDWTLGRSWLVSTAAGALGLLALGAAIYAATPPGTWRKVGRAMRAAQAAQDTAQPPAWLDRVAPGATEQARRAREARRNGDPTTTDRVMHSSPVRSYLMLMTAALALMIWTAIVGTMGWGCALLVGFGLTGRWARSAPARLPGDPATDDPLAV